MVGIASITTTRGGIVVRRGRKRGLATIAARIAVIIIATTMFCTFSDLSMVLFYLMVIFLLYRRREPPPSCVAAYQIYIIQHVAARFLPLQYSKALTPVYIDTLNRGITSLCPCTAFAVWSLSLPTLTTIAAVSLPRFRWRQTFKGLYLRLFLLNKVIKITNVTRKSLTLQQLKAIRSGY